MGPGTQRKYLNSLSKLFDHASYDGYVPKGYNPVSELPDKPTADYEEAEWLEVPDAALLLHAASLYEPKRADLAVPFAYPLIATFLLTGGRQAEVLGLEVTDINFARKTVTFRRKKTRRLKTRGSYRVVPLWPQLEAILRAYLTGPHAPKGPLLFPSPDDPAKRLNDIRKILKQLASRIDREEGSLGSKIFRHTYCAARLQTLDGGAPVAEYTVVRHRAKRASEVAAPPVLTEEELYGSS